MLTEGYQRRAASGPERPGPWGPTFLISPYPLTGAAPLHTLGRLDPEDTKPGFKLAQHRLTEAKP